MYANRSLICKAALLLPTCLVVGIIFAMVWLFYSQIMCEYWGTRPVSTIFLSLLFFASAGQSLANLLCCTFTNPGKIEPDWPHVLYMFIVVEPSGDAV